MSDFLFGSDPTPSQVVDPTPNEFVNLRAPLANTLRNQLFQGGARPLIFEGPFAAPLGPNEQTALGNIREAAGQVGVPGPGQQALISQAGGQFNPFAGLTGLEQFGLQNVAGQAFGQSPNQLLAQNALGGQLGGQFNPFAQAAGLTGAEQAGLQSIQQQAFGANPLQQTVNQQLGAIAGTGINPQLNQLIETAQRPIFEQFSREALGQRGLFTGAGQQVQGSSPFTDAGEQLVGRAATAAGDVATNLTAQLNAQQQQAQLAALGLAQQQPGITLQQMLAGQQALGLPRQVEQLGLNLQGGAFEQGVGRQLAAAGLSDQLSNNALTRALQGLGAAGVGQERQGQAFEAGANRQLQAGTQLSAQDLAGQQAQLQAQLQNLQAQGLPRMIEQLGIQGGLAEFQRQQAQMQQLLALLGGLSSGTPVVLPGVSGTPGVVQSFVGGFGEGLGSTVSDRRVKKDISLLGKLRGIGIYSFRFINQANDAPKTNGVMADEVAHIPGAVEAKYGLMHVNYPRVIEHIMEPAYG